MIQINTYEAKKNFSELLKKVAKGERVIIASHNKPVAELIPTSIKKNKKRPFGLCTGEFKIPKSFFDPLPESILNEFEGK
jgi:prevent-host-death family protein